MFASIAVLSLVSALFSFIRLERDRREYELLARAYEVRTSYNASFKIYAEALGWSRRYRHIFLYNLGNTTFNKAVAEKSLPALKSALEYYNEAIRMNPYFMEAKKNAEILNKFISGLEVRSRNLAEEPNGDRRPQRGQKPGITPYEPTKP